MLAGMDEDQSKSISKEEFTKYFREFDKATITSIGHTVLNYPKAKVEAAVLPFRAMDAKRQGVIATKHFVRWFERKAREDRTLKIYDELEPQLKVLKERDTITFWEWMNLLVPANDEHGNAITRTRLLCAEVVGLCLAPSMLYNMAPRMNIVILICGSRGDVQPFIPIGQILKSIGHRVRLATHENFRDFVTKNGLEFYPIGGDPKQLMSYMVQSKGQLMPGISQLISPQYWRDTGDRFKMMSDIIMSGWEGANCPDVKGDNKPFKADVIISNPTTYCHVHLAEAMGVPLHMFFTMPWSPTSAFPHPMGNVAYKELKASKAQDKEVVDFLTAQRNRQKAKTKSAWVDDNVYSYRKVDLMMHVGMGSIFSDFRKKHGLDPNWKEGSSIIHEREVPFAYTWSPALIPKPLDWGDHVDVVGFSELKGSGFTKPPPEDIDAWIKKEPARPPVFIGFGSCVIPDVKKVSETIVKAAKQAGVRVIIQQGWAGLGKHLKGVEGVSFVKGAKFEDGKEAPELDMDKKDFCLVIGRVAHSWLFDMVAGVCHHGGAGTTYAGLIAARPTLVAPFFGDQPFWGQMVNNAGAGPKPTPVDQWKPDMLAKKFTSMFSKGQKKAALELSRAMKRENGAKESVRVFHEKLNIGQLECDLLQTDVAKFYVPNWRLKLGKRALTIMRKHQPDWFPILMGSVHRYTSCDWGSGCMPGFKEEIKDLRVGDLQFSEEDVDTVLRNLKAILDTRGPLKGEGTVVHPDPRLRI
uniref:EF-hand domain-containing protein n=1 Tax=Lotharella globosa TaxID=91324 RepID=A0A7S3ZCB6_9EUKA